MRTSALKRRLAACLCAALALVAPACLAEESFVGFTLPQGVVQTVPAQVSALAAPDGLAPMYALMGNAQAQSDVYVFRMPNGRALLSVGRSVKDDAPSVTALKAAWPTIAALIGQEARYIDASADCVRLGSRFGYDTLEIATSAVLSDDESLKVLIGCTAFCRGKELIELWTVSPAETVYLFDEAAQKERESDLTALDALLQSLDFGDAGFTLTLPQSAPGATILTQPYADPGGRFEVSLPAGCRILTAQSPASEAEALRAELIKRFGEGAGTFFDVNYSDVQKEDATFVLLKDLSASAMIYRVLVPDFQKSTYRDLMRLWEATQTGLTGKFGSANCLKRDGATTIAGQPHAWTSYWLRTQQTDILLNLFSCVDTGGWLREVDVFTMMDAKQNDQQSALMYALLSSLRYIIPAQ